MRLVGSFSAAANGHPLQWSAPRSLPNTTRPKWNWIGVGPPGSIELRHAPYTGRIVVPIYHGEYRGNLANNKVHGSVLLSDDGGETFRVASAAGFGAVDKFTNENQAVELADGTVLVNGRSLASPGGTQRRIQTLSTDGGTTFPTARYVPELPQPLGGCEGSIVSTPNGSLVYFSGPASTLLRERMTLWSSSDGGATYHVVCEVDTGMSGYSSLQLDCANAPAAPTYSGAPPAGVCTAVLLLYEQTDQQQVVMTPDRFIFRRIPI